MSHDFLVSKELLHMISLYILSDLLTILNLSSLLLQKYSYFSIISKVPYLYLSRNSFYIQDPLSIVLSNVAFLEHLELKQKTRSMDCSAKNTVSLQEIWRNWWRISHPWLDSETRFSVSWFVEQQESRNNTTQVLRCVSLRGSFITWCSTRYRQRRSRESHSIFSVCSVLL